MAIKKLRTGTHVKINQKWDKAHYHPKIAGTIDGKWSETSYTVDFGYIPPNADHRYQVVVPAEFLIVTKEAPKKYKHPNSPTMDKVEAFTQNLHGSGIDYEWSIEENKSSFRASNAFHTMDEGMYDGAAAFTVVFPKGESMGEFKLEFNGQEAQRLNKKHMLRGYLDETIAYTLDRANLR